MWWWFSSVRLFVIPWIVARQAPLSIGLFSRHEYWSALPFPSPGDRPDPGIESGLLYYRQVLYQTRMGLDTCMKDSCCWNETKGGIHAVSLFCIDPGKRCILSSGVMEVPFLTSLSRQHRWVEVGKEGWHLSLGSRVSRKRDLDLPG